MTFDRRFYTNFSDSNHLRTMKRRRGMASAFPVPNMTFVRYVSGNAVEMGKGQVTGKCESQSRRLKGISSTRGRGQDETTFLSIYFINATSLTVYPCPMMACASPRLYNVLWRGCLRSYKVPHIRGFKYESDGGDCVFEKAISGGF